MTAKTAETVLPRMVCDGFGFDCELLTACARFDLPIHEVPVCVRYEDAASTTGAGSTVRMLRQLWQIRARWRKQVPAPQLPDGFQVEKLSAPGSTLAA